MSKVVNATCSESSAVLVAGVVVQDAVILSLGKKASSGLLIIDEDRASYVTSSATDIKDTIVKLVSIVAQIATVLTAHDSVTNAPGASAAAIGQLNTLKTELDAMKDTLK